MKKIFTQVEQPLLATVNTDTGEIVSGVATLKVTSVDEFIMVFLNSLPQVFDLEGQQLKVLMCCWKYSSFNPSAPEGNRIVNSKAFKEYVRSNGLDISDAAIDNAFSIMAKKRILVKECRGQYLLNPEYFFKGTLSNRAKLQLNITTE